MTDQIDAENPAAIGPEYNGQPILPITVLAGQFLDRPIVAFDCETGDAGPAEVAAACRARVKPGLVSIAYCNGDTFPDLGAAIEDVGLRWASAEQWAGAVAVAQTGGLCSGVFFWAAAPGTPAGSLPAWTGPLTPLLVQDRWQGDTDLSSVYSAAYAGRVAGYLDGATSGPMWAGAWSRFAPLTFGPAPKPTPTPPAPKPPAPTPPRECPVNLPELIQGAGMTGPANESVWALQALLDLRSHPVPIAEDGRFGPSTEAAVRSYQEEARLLVDGKVGTHTWGALLGAPQ